MVTRWNRRLHGLPYIQLLRQVCKLCATSARSKVSWLRRCLQGQVLSLASAGEFLFSGGQDGTIAVWKFDAASQSFMSAVSSAALCRAVFL